LEQLRILAYATLSDVITYEPGHGFELLPVALQHPALESIKEWTDASGQRRIRGVSLRGRTEALMLLARYFKLVGDGKPWDHVQNFSVVIVPPGAVPKPLAQAQPKPVGGTGAARSVVVGPEGVDGGGRRALAAQLEQSAGAGSGREAGGERVRTV